MKSEIFEKYQRILQLSRMGFNTPRMQYITPSMLNKPVFLQKRIEGFLRRKKAKFANIRTYIWDKGKEGWNSKHLIFVPVEEVYQNVVKLLQEKRYCMVDVENPKAGVIAGNIEIRFSDKSFVAEFVMKDEGAMVRDVDISSDVKYCYGKFDGKVVVDNTNLDKVPEQVIKAVGICFRLFKLPCSSAIIEFSATSEPQGVLKDNLIFWEYRDCRK